MPRKKRGWRPWDDAADEMGKMLIRLPCRTIAQLKYVVAAEDRTMQKTIERILIPALGALAEQAYQQANSMTQPQ